MRESILENSSLASFVIFTGLPHSLLSLLFYLLVEKAWFANIHLAKAAKPKHLRKYEQKDVDFSHWTASAELQI